MLEESVREKYCFEWKKKRMKPDLRPREWGRTVARSRTQIQGAPPIKRDSNIWCPPDFLSTFVRCRSVKAGSNVRYSSVCPFQRPGLHAGDFFFVLLYYFHVHIYGWSTSCKRVCKPCTPLLWPDFPATHLHSVQQVMWTARCWQ